MNIKLLFMSMSICLSGTACSFGEAKQHSKDLSDKYSEDNSIAQTEKQKKNIIKKNILKKKNRATKLMFLNKVKS